MPFRDHRVYLTAEDLEAERRELQVWLEKQACRNPFKRLWWRLTGQMKLREPEPDPPASWESYPTPPRRWGSR